MVCLDTSIIIDILRGKKEVAVLLDKLEKNNDIVTITTITLMELINGVYLNNKSPNELEKINNLLESFIILDFNRESAFMAGKIEADLTKQGEKIEIEDIMIGAIAIVNNEKLITNNHKHFSKIKDLQIENY